MNKNTALTNQYEFLVIPYRDQYFIDQYGWTVRDLMITKALVESDRVNKITVINRPVTLYERFSTKRSKKKITVEKISYLDTTSFDLIGPLKRRGWTEYCYDDIIKNVAEKFKPHSSINRIVLDFTPLAKIDYGVFEKDIPIWYDLIDNFTKHNRFTVKQKSLVEEKYRYIQKKASFITGVTHAALKQFDDANTLAITNGLTTYPKKGFRGEPIFAFGFVGFITDKLDVDFLISLAKSTNEDIAVFGHAYDRKITKVLNQAPNIRLFGEFNERQLTEILTTFEIGLIPYREELSHDGSPIKLYQYLNSGLPVLTTQDFEDVLAQNRYVKFVKSNDPSVAIDFLNRIRIERKKNKRLFHDEVRNQMDDSILWSSKIKLILNELDKLKMSVPIKTNCSVYSKTDQSS